MFEKGWYGSKRLLCGRRYGKCGKAFRYARLYRRGGGIEETGTRGRQTGAGGEAHANRIQQKAPFGLCVGRAGKQSIKLLHAIQSVSALSAGVSYVKTFEDFEGLLLFYKIHIIRANLSEHYV